MKHGVDALERRCHVLGNPDVSSAELDGGIQIGRYRPIVAVDLRIEHVQDAHAMTLRNQEVGGVRAYEPGSASDKDVNLPIASG